MTESREQLAVLATQFTHRRQDFEREVMTNRDAVFLHLSFWRAELASASELASSATELLVAVERAWSDAFPSLPLPKAD